MEVAAAAADRRLPRPLLRLLLRLSERETRSPAAGAEEGDVLSVDRRLLRLPEGALRHPRHLAVGSTHILAVMPPGRLRLQVELSQRPTAAAIVDRTATPFRTTNSGPPRWKLAEEAAAVTGPAACPPGKVGQTIVARRVVCASRSSRRTSTGNNNDMNPIMTMAMETRTTAIAAGRYAAFFIRLHRLWLAAGFGSGFVAPSRDGRKGKEMRTAPFLDRIRARLVVLPFPLA